MSRLLFINLGPALPREYQEGMLGSLLEPPNYVFENPPGLGIATLSLLFTASAAMRSWMALDPRFQVVDTFQDVVTQLLIL
jgi:hypothetical protein